MGRKKYKYNPETLNYEAVELTLKQKLLKTSYFFVPGLVFSFIVVGISFNTIKKMGALEEKRRSENLLQDYKKVSKTIAKHEQMLVRLKDNDDNLYRSIFGVDPYPSWKREPGTGGNPRKYKRYRNWVHSDLIIETHKRLESVRKKIAAQIESNDSLIVLVRRKEQMLQSIPSIQPVANKELRRIASGFGMRMHPILKIMKMHEGLDFTVDVGTDIYATGNGSILFAGWKSGYGKTVVIDHGFGYQTLYAHCHSFNVRKGQKVNRGDLIAYSGNTGMSSGPHLHYEVKYKGRATDPVNYLFNELSPEEYEQVLELSTKANQSL